MNTAIMKRWFTYRRVAWQLCGAFLVLGGGDGLALKHLMRYGSIEQIDLVDLDPGMTHLGQTFSTFRAAESMLLKSYL